MSKQIVSEGDIATWFVEAVKSALNQFGWRAMEIEWYATADCECFGPDRLEEIPRNRRLGVWVHVTYSRSSFSFFWDGLEQSVSSFVGRTHDRIAEIRCSRFPAASPCRERIAAAAEAVVRETLSACE